MAVVKKRIIYTEPVCVLIKGVTLLPIEECEAAMVKDDWWLRSPGDYDDWTACVYGVGSVIYDGHLSDVKKWLEEWAKEKGVID